MINKICSECEHKFNGEITNLCVKCAEFKYKFITNKFDNINNPKHYTTGNIECIEYIEDKLSKDALEGYFIGNVIKYVTRYKEKNGLEDIKKAQWYLNRMIKNMEGEADE